jgi:hypothetical protein
LLSDEYTGLEMYAERPFDLLFRDPQGLRKNVYDINLRFTFLYKFSSKQFPP